MDQSASAVAQLSVQDGSRAVPTRSPVSPVTQSQEESSSPKTFGVTLTSRQKAVSEPAAPPVDPSSPADAESFGSGAAVFGITLGAKPIPRRTTSVAEDVSVVRARSAESHWTF